MKNEFREILGIRKNNKIVACYLDCDIDNNFINRVINLLKAYSKKDILDFVEKLDIREYNDVTIRDEYPQYKLLIDNDDNWQKYFIKLYSNLKFKNLPILDVSEIFSYPDFIGTYLLINLDDDTIYVYYKHDKQISKSIIQLNFWNK